MRAFIALLVVAALSAASLAFAPAASACPDEIVVTTGSGTTTYYTYGPGYYPSTYYYPNTYYYSPGYTYSPGYYSYPSTYYYPRTYYYPSYTTYGPSVNVGFGWRWRR